MGAVGFTGVLPEDVAGLTMFQLERDYLGQVREIREQIKRASERPKDAPDPPPVDDANVPPTRDEWVAHRLQEEINEKTGQKWTTEEANAEYDRMLLTFAED